MLIKEGRSPLEQVGVVLGGGGASQRRERRGGACYVTSEEFLMVWGTRVLVLSRILLWFIIVLKQKITMIRGGPPIHPPEMRRPPLIRTL